MYRNVESLVCDMVVFSFWGFYNHPSAPFHPLRQLKGGGEHFIAEVVKENRDLTLEWYLQVTIDTFEGMYNRRGIISRK